MNTQPLTPNEAKRSLYKNGISHTWVSIHGNPLVILVHRSDMRGDKLTKYAESFGGYIDGGVSPNDKPQFTDIMHYIK